MSKFLKFITFSFFMLTIMIVTLIKLDNFIVGAQDVTILSTEQYKTYLDENVTTSEYYTDFSTTIKNYFSTFNITPETFEEKVPGESEYKILEITPRTYLGDDSAIISDINTNVESIKEIYQTATVNNDVTNKYFISNLGNFSTDTMTIKEFVANRDDLDGKYDAIVFAAGNYSKDQVYSCSTDFSNEELTYQKLYNQNKLIYEGYTKDGQPHGLGTKYVNGEVVYYGTFRNGEYDGYGALYDKGVKAYIGGFIDGVKNCYGVIYEEGYALYMGQWRNDKYHGYGLLFNPFGFTIYQGYWEYGLKVSSPRSVDVLNDITDTKANQVITEFVEKGIPVFISKDALLDSNSNLYEHFNNLPNEYPNVFLLNYDDAQTRDNIGFYQTLSIMGITELLSPKPHFNVVSQPIQYKEQPNYSYSINDTLDFTIDLINKENANLNFYVDVNQNEKFDADEAYSNALIKGENTFSVNVPNIDSGLLKYKIEVTNDTLTSTYTGAIKVKNEVKDIKVLNIVSDMVYNKGSLFNDTLYDRYFQNNGDYKITVDSCKIRDFSKNNPKYECSHNTVLDNYDVIILGQDIFNKPLNPDVYNSLQEQIDNGKPVIFTSSVTKGNQKWLDYFSDELSLSNYRTDLYKLSSNVDKLEIVNHSNYVLYPFNLNNEKLTIPEDLNYTLNEQYQLDLDNPDLVPLMNMYSTTDPQFDRFDSYNNFYYMKNNNVVYVNVGNNSFNEYKDLEHKLLVDSIVNLFIQTNAKNNEISELLFTNTYENILIDVKDSVSFDFSVFSANSDSYTYQIFVDDRELANGSTVNNEVVPITLDNIAVVERNTVKPVRIRVVINNDKNESNTYGFYVYVANLETYGINFNRSLNTISETSYIEVDVTGVYRINYNFNINSIKLGDFDTSTLPETIVVKDIVFNETIPEGIVVDNSQNELTVTTNDSNETIVSKNIANITYTLIDGEYRPSTSNISFTIPIRATSSNSYTLDNAKITYNGISKDSDIHQFSKIDFTAIKPLDGMKVKTVFTDYLLIPTNSSIDDLAKQFIFDPDVVIAEIKFNNISTNDSNIFEYNDVLHSLTSIGMGEEIFTMVARDILNNEYTLPFTVKTYKMYFTNNSLNMLTGQEFNNLDPENPNIQFSDDLVGSTLTWSSSNQAVATVDENGVIKAVGAGEATITTRIVGNESVSASITVKVTEKIGFDPSYNSGKQLFDNQEYDLNEYIIYPDIYSGKLAFEFSYDDDTNLEYGYTNGIFKVNQLTTVDYIDLVVSVAITHTKDDGSKEILNDSMTLRIYPFVDDSGNTQT